MKQGTLDLEDKTLKTIAMQFGWCGACDCACVRVCMWHVCYKLQLELHWMNCHVADDCRYPAKHGTPMPDYKENARKGTMRFDNVVY